MSARVLVALWVLASGAACSPPRVARVGGENEENSGSDATSADWNEESGAEAGDSEPGETSSSGADDDGPRYDVQSGGFDLPYGEHYCPVPLSSTLLDGETALGGFTGRRAFFGDVYGDARIIVYDDTADLAHELGYAAWTGGSIDGGPAIEAVTFIDPQALPSTTVDAIDHLSGDQTSPFMASITIEELDFAAGDFDLPEVIHGKLERWPEDAGDGIEGSFAAVHCALFDEHFPIE